MGMAQASVFLSASLGHGSMAGGHPLGIAQAEATGMGLFSQPGKATQGLGTEHPASSVQGYTIPM